MFCADRYICSTLGSGGQESTGIRPWFWILSMLVMPVLGNIAYQYYIVVMTRALANAESILTQILFDYSLKVRITMAKNGEGEGNEGQQGNGKKSQNSFIGRLTNLATIDMNNIIG